jgi:hypothetical protein
MEIPQELRLPQIAIFWVPNNNLISRTENAKDVTPIGGFRNTQYDHRSSWDKIKKSAKLQGEWTETPRVVFFTMRKKKSIGSSLPHKLPGIKVSLSKLCGTSHYQLRTRFSSRKIDILA